MSRITKGLVIALAAVGANAGKHHGSGHHGSGHHGGKKEEDKKAYVAGPVAINTGAPTYTCHLPYELIDNQCVKTEIVDHIQSCKFGSFVNGECLEYTDLIYKCEPGYSAIDDAKKSHHGGGGGHGYSHHGGGHHGGHGDKKSALGCFKMENAFPLNVCPAGSQQSANNPSMCENSWSSPPRSYCPVRGKKHKHHGNGDKHAVDCIDYKSVAPLAVCAHGLELRNGTCVGEEQYPCESEFLCVGYGCADGSGGKKKHLRRLQEEEEKSQATSSASSSTVDEAPVDEEPIDESVVDRVLGKKKIEQLVEVPSKKGMCTRFNQSAPLLECPPGTISTGKKHDGHSHGGDYGHHGSHHGGKKNHVTCYQPMNVDLVYDCDSGFLDRDTNQCIQNSIIASEEQCPPGFDECYDKKGSSKNGSLPCCRSTFAPPIKVCPVGFSAANSVCVRAHAVKEMCPPNYADIDGVCIQKWVKAPTELFNITMCQGKGCDAVAHGGRGSIPQVDIDRMAYVA